MQSATGSGDFGTFLSYKRVLLSLTSDLKRLEAICDRLELPATRNLAEQALRGLTEDRFQVAVVGEFKRGKSTLLNALLGREVLPADILPCSATLNRVTYGLTPEVEVQYRDGSRKAVPIDQLAEYVTRLTEESERTSAQVAEAVVRYPVPYCRHGVDLIDTPGLNDDAAMTEITLSVLPEVDAALFLISAQAPLSQTERDFLRTRVLASDLAQVLFVVTGIDRCESAAEIDRVTTHVQNWVERAVGDAIRSEHGADSDEYRRYERKIGVPRVFPVSARQAIRARAGGDTALFEASRFPAFEAALERFLTEERGTLSLQVPVNRALTVCAGIRDYLDRELRVTETAPTLSEAESEVANLRAFRASFGEAVDRISGETRIQLDGALQLLSAQVQLQVELAIARADLTGPQLARSPQAAAAVLAARSEEAVDNALRIVFSEVREILECGMKRLQDHWSSAVTGPIPDSPKIEALCTAVRDRTARLREETEELLAPLRVRFAGIRVDGSTRQIAVDALSAAVSTLGKVKGIWTGYRPAGLSDAAAAARATGSQFTEEWIANFKEGFRREAEDVIRVGLAPAPMRRMVAGCARELFGEVRDRVTTQLDAALDDARRRQISERAERDRSDAGRELRSAELARLAEEVERIRSEAFELAERLSAVPRAA